MTTQAELNAHRLTHMALEDFCNGMDEATDRQLAEDVLHEIGRIVWGGSIILVLEIDETVYVMRADGDRLMMEVNDL